MIKFSEQLHLLQFPAAASSGQRTSVMPFVFPNPLTQSLKVLSSYRDLLRDMLGISGLSHEDIDIVTQNLVADRGIYLSLNPRYRLGPESFPHFCQRHTLSDVLPDRIKIDHLFAHQEKAIQSILANMPTIVATGTGSGKTETFLIPILDHCLKHRTVGIKALIVYPMNALANDQLERIGEYTQDTPITFGAYTGTTPRNASEVVVEPLSPNHRVYRDDILASPPDILITNYVMLDWMLTRQPDRTMLAEAADTLKYLVFDEIHVYRGSNATHIKYLLARLRATLGGAGSIVPIGTSATLGGHDDRQAVDDFVKPLLNVEDYVFVGPILAEEPTIEPVPIPVLTGQQVELSRFALDNRTALSTLSALTGQQLSEWDMGEADFHETQTYRAVAQNEFVVELRKLLYEKGAQNLPAIAALARRLVPEGTTVPPEDVAHAYIAAVSFINHLAKGHPVLDFRLHLFLREIGGYLKKCIRCEIYHSGEQECCPECGYPLFFVYRHDIRKCIAKISGHRLRWNVWQESDDQPAAFYVLLSTDPSASEEDTALRFSDRFTSLTDDGGELQHAPDGRLAVEWLNLEDPHDVTNLLIPLTPRGKDHHYLTVIVDTLLREAPSKPAKALAFIDNREHASRYSAIMSDELAHRFLRAFLQLHYPIERQLDLEATLKHLEKSVPDPTSEQEKALFEELPLWYYRLISQPPRDGDLITIQLRNSAQFSALEQQILQIFIEERAIAKPEELTFGTSKFIRFGKHWATYHKGICFRGQQSGSREYPAVVLSDTLSAKYAKFVSQAGIHEIEMAIQGLIERGVIIQRLVPGKVDEEPVPHYYLDLAHLWLDIPIGEHVDYPHLRESELQFAALHSSEIPAAERKQLEDEFKRGQINFVIATPTLELGIDIGELETVMMIGVPPSPANYAQRAGRAGRRENRAALIITFCRNGQSHDDYYFDHPTELINGVVSPPRFDPFKWSIVQKHVNAVVLTEHLHSRDALEHALSQFDMTVGRRTAELIATFGEWIEAHLHEPVVSEECRPLIDKLRRHTGGMQSFCYNSGLFPDYGFRRDEVFVFNVRDEPQVEALSHLSSPEASELAITQRPPEMAYRTLVPGATIYAGGEIYTLLEKGKYKTLKSGSTRPRRSYELLYAVVKAEPDRDKITEKYQVITLFDDRLSYSNWGGVLQVAYSPACNLMFVNGGLKTGGEELGDREAASGGFDIAYQLKREALILAFDSMVCHKDEVRLSLLSALYHSVMARAGLAEGELGLLLDLKPTSRETTGRWFAALYDKSGNHSVMLDEAYNNFQSIIETADQGMRSCECVAGCYECLKSYSTSYLGHSIDKSVALMFTGYLLGQSRFDPSIGPMKETVLQPDMELYVSLQGQEIVVMTGSARYSEYIQGHQNDALFTAIAEAIHSQHRPHMRTARIATPLSYLANALSGGRVKKGRAAFERLQLQLLRFSVVDVTEARLQ